MLTPRAILLLVAAILLIIAARPPAGVAVRLELLAAAFVVLAWLV